jgi:octaprenyl-diphosphate synthase
MVETKSLSALEMLASASVTIIESEVWQLELINKIDMLESEYIKLITGKTAVLFAAACATPAVVVGLHENEINALYSFGLNLGIAFQITDDLLDYTSQNQKFGKVIGSDLLEGKITLPLIILRSLLSKEEYRIFSESFTSQSIDNIITLLNKHNCINRCTQIASRYSVYAIEQLNKLPKNNVINLLIELTKFLVQRIH